MSWNRRMEHDLDRDIEHHLALETEDNIARGMSPEEARYAALRKFGNITRVKEDTRSVWTRASLDTLYADLRHALRRIRIAPGTAILAVLSLALAFAPSVTVFAIMDRFFFSPLGLRNPDELVQIQFRDTRPNVRYSHLDPSYPEFQDLRRSLTSFSGLTYEGRSGAVVALNGRRIFSSMHMVSDGYFDMLGLPLHSGPGLSWNHPGVIISYSFWKREFDGRPDVIGRQLLITGQAFTIDGITAPDFRGTDKILEADLWTTVEGWSQLQPRYGDSIEQRDARNGAIWARLRPGVPRAQAAAEVERAALELSRQWPATNRYVTARVHDTLAENRRDTWKITAIGAFLLGIVLAVACANVAGILLARAEERRHETAVRQALGASRGRLIREWMIESAVLSTLGAALGLAGAGLLLNRLPSLFPAMVTSFFHFEFALSPRAWLYAAALALFSTLSFGLVAAWRGSRPDLLSGLRRDAAVSVLTVRVPIRSLLIVLQVAAAEALLFSAGLALNTLSFVHHMDPGFDPQRPIALARLISTAEDGEVQPFDCDALCDRLARIAGVRRAAYGGMVPLSGTSGFKQQLQIPGQEPREIYGSSTGPAFLSTFGVRLLSGRDLQRADQHGILVNATLARQLDPAGNAVGRQVRLDGALVQIVGVFQDVALNSIHDRPQPRTVTLAAAHSASETFALEVTGNPNAYVAALRKELLAAQPGSIVMTSQTLWQHYQDALFAERIATQSFYGLGLIALLLTITGLHGITAALFARRSKEFAIRLALGAAPGRIVRTVLANGLKLAAAGLLLGLAIAVPLALLVGSKLPGFSPWSAPALWFSSAIVLVAAIAAALHPARRVLGIQPADIIRTE